MANTFLQRSLCLCAFMVLVMIGLGGYTRLSGAGLSMVTWQPIIGALPPLSESAWQDVFQQYQMFPEFQKVNFNMSLAEFKRIYLIEYFHRLWGRAIGFALLVPTIYAFFKARYILPRLGVIWLLGGLQGLMGWYMVKSGLVKDPMVSPYRLLAHLALALGIFAFLIHTIYKLRPQSPKIDDSRLKKLLGIYIFFVCLTISYGALTAGFHGGYIYNTFPDMNGHLLPEDIFFLHPWWSNFIANPATLQFIHRVLALSTLAFGLYISLTLWFLNFRGMALTLGVVLSLQVAMGIFTLVLQVPVILGVAHQLWAMIVFAVSSYVYFNTESTDH